MLRCLSIPNIFARKDYYEIDERIKALVDAINATGQVETIASCQGHGSPFRPPYVYFRTTVEIAATIERKLQEYYTTGRLNTFWTLQGIFDGQYHLCFLLLSPRHDEQARSIIQSFFTFFLFRCQLDEDLKALFRLFQEDLLDLLKLRLELRPFNEPKVRACSDDRC